MLCGYRHWDGVVYIYMKAPFGCWKARVGSFKRADRPTGRIDLYALPHVASCSILRQCFLCRRFPIKSMDDSSDQIRSIKCFHVINRTLEHAGRALDSEDMHPSPLTSTPDPGFTTSPYQTPPQRAPTSPPPSPSLQICRNSCHQQCPLHHNPRPPFPG